MSTLKEQFTEKVYLKYDNGQWINSILSDVYMYLEYYTEGGYGSIHKIMNKTTGEHLILKHSSKKDFRHTNNLGVEASFMMLAYQHCGGLKLHAYYDDHDHYILIMQQGGTSLDNVFYCHSRKIKELVRTSKCLTNMFYKNHIQTIVNLMIKVYHKNEELYRCGIHHNDLKLENILLYDNEVTIIDFGVSKAVEDSYTSYRGSLECVPYEYLAYGSYKPYDQTLWCFGVMMYILCFMALPFNKEEDLLNGDIDHEKLKRIPEGMAALISECLNKDPVKRPLNLLQRLTDLL
jgi:serine/threonine protein kinase